MQLGRFTIEQLNEGQFEFFKDGRINRTPVSETQDEKIVSPQRKLLGINPLYVSDGQHHILLDTGLGWGLDAGSEYTDISNISTNLDIFGASPADITHVVLTHLHYDHAAGLSYTDASAATYPTFPNATFYVQQAEWDFAVDQVQHDPPGSKFYNLDDLYRLYADDFFELLNSNQTEIIPGIKLIKTGGHTPGHQVIKITDGKDSAYFLGDLLSKTELSHNDVTRRHTHSTQTKKMRIQLLRQAYKENAILFLYHSLSSKPCQLTMDKDRNYMLKELG